MVNSKFLRTGSLGGGQTMTVTGNGFNSSATIVTIDGEKCEVDTSASQSETQLICKSPSATGKVL